MTTWRWPGMAFLTCAASAAPSALPGCHPGSSTAAATSIAHAAAQWRDDGEVVSGINGWTLRPTIASQSTGGALSFWSCSIKIWHNYLLV